MNDTADASRTPDTFPDDPDFAAPLFFLSHANARDTVTGTSGTDVNEPFLTFFTDLSHNINQLVYRPPGADPGFVDKGMSSGVDWEREILGAVSSCQVFIALISEPYFRREWCGKEWDAFTRRQAWHRAERREVDSPCVVPVIWAPLGARRHPKVVASRQMFTPKDGAIATRYTAEGIFGLLKTDLEAYRTTVWMLAKEMQRLIFAYWVEPCVAPRIADLRDVFHEEAP